MKKIILIWFLLYSVYSSGQINPDRTIIRHGDTTFLMTYTYTSVPDSMLRDSTHCYLIIDSTVCDVVQYQFHFNRIISTTKDSVQINKFPVLNNTTLLTTLGYTPHPQLVSGTNIKTINSNDILGSGDVPISGTAAWGSVTGTLSNQTDLNTALNGKQDFMGRKVIALWQPAGNSTTITAVGAAALTATGTATAANVATTNKHTWSKRLEYLVTVAAATAVAGFRNAVAVYGMGNAAGQGGFTYVCRFGPATGVATTTHRLFVGMANSTAAPTDVEPSSIVNIFGIGYDAADANIQFMRNDGSGTATKIDLGANFAVPTVDRTAVYELYMTCSPNSTTITYEVINLTTGNVATGSVNTDLPSNTTLLAPRGWMSVGGTSSVIGIALMNLNIQTNF